MMGGVVWCGWMVRCVVEGASQVQTNGGPVDWQTSGEAARLGSGHGNGHVARRLHRAESGLCVGRICGRRSEVNYEFVLLGGTGLQNSLIIITRDFLLNLFPISVL